MPAPYHQPAPPMTPPPLPVSRGSAHPCSGDGCSCAIFAAGGVSATYCTCGHPQHWHSAQGRKASVSVSGAGGHRGSGSAPSSPSCSPCASPSSARRGLKPPPFMPTAAAADSRRPSASPPPLPCSLSFPVSHFSATYPPAASSPAVVPLPSPPSPSMPPATAPPPPVSRPASMRVSAGGSMYSAYLVKHGLVSSVPPPPPPQLLKPAASTAPHCSSTAAVPPPLPAASTNARSASVCTPPPIPSPPASPGFLSPPSRPHSVSVSSAAADLSSPKRSHPPPVPLFAPSPPAASAAPPAADSSRVSAMKLNRPPPIIPPAASATSSAPPSASPPSSSPTASSSAAGSPPPPSLSPDAFATHLHHRVDVVSQHCASGLQLVKAMRSFFHSFSSLQQRYASDVERLIQSEVQRLSSSCQQDDVGSAHCLHNVYVSLLMKVGSAGVKQAGCGHDVSLQCVDLLDSFCHAGGAAVREHEAEAKRQATAMEKLQATVAKEREVARQALSGLAHKRERESAGTAALDAARRKALKSCEGYEKAIETANLSYAQHQQRELPALLSQMQTLEEMRLQSLHTALASFASLSCDLSSSLSAVSADVKQLVGSLNAEQDIIKCFISRVIQEHGPPLPAQPFCYDMAVTAAELRQEIEAEERIALQHSAAAAAGAGGGGLSAAGGAKRQPSLFYTKLEDVMEYERRLLDDSAASAPCSSLPSWPPEVPRLLPVLLSAIEALSGFTSEGIFRLSVPSDALHTARKQLDSGQYASIQQLTDPHVPAALLKAWLRDLSEPLVPFASYDRCIEIGRGGGEDADAGIASVLSLASSWPALNRRVLFLLLHFLHRLSGGPWVEQSRMTRANLAIVFAPGLLRSESSDPAVLMRDSKHACQAVALLIESAGRDSGWDEERRWKAQWDARSGGGRQAATTATRHRGSVAVSPPPVPAQYRTSPSPTCSPPQSPSTAARLSFADRHAALAPPQAALDSAPVVVHGPLPPSPVRPAEGGLPPLWRAQLDPASNETYYYNIATLQSQWNKPQ